MIKIMSIIASVFFMLNYQIVYAGLDDNKKIKDSLIEWEVKIEIPEDSF